MATTDQEKKNEPKGIFHEVCIQSDWSLRLHHPGLGALLLLLLVIVNETWNNYSMICESIPFFQPKENYNYENGEINNKPYRGPSASRLGPKEWRRSHEACLRAICKIANKIEFDCQVDETGESAHMMVIDDPFAHPITFDSQIPFPFDCHHALQLMIGSDQLDQLYDNLRSYWFQAETIDFIHLYEDHLQSATTASETPSEDGSSDSEIDMNNHQNKKKKKALFQILPGQCAVWEIFQQSWYEWYDDPEIHGEPPPPIPLVNLDKAQPGEVVRIRAREYLCYEEYIPKEDLSFWIRAYEKLLKYRWYPSFVATFLASAIIELLGLGAAMARFLPLTICFWTYASSNDNNEPNNNDGGGYKMLRTMMEVWRIWMHFIGIHAMTSAIAFGSQVYVVCLLATSSMLLYGNTKASMEWIFLHILSYGMEFFEAVPTIDGSGDNEPTVVASKSLEGVMDMIVRSIDEVLDLFLPMPGLLFKAIVVYMIYMSSSRLLNKHEEAPSVD